MKLIGAQNDSSIDSMDMTTLLQLLLNKDIVINVFETEGRWCEVDTEQDLGLYVAITSSNTGEVWSHDWRW